jgi:hypothetical protein
MATSYASASVTVRTGSSVRSYAGASVSVGPAAPAVRGYSGPGEPVYHLSSSTRDYAVSRQVTGATGGCTRPLVGLLHPPARRGNRA